MLPKVRGHLEHTNTRTRLGVCAIYFNKLAWIQFKFGYIESLQKVYNDWTLYIYNGYIAAIEWYLWNVERESIQCIDYVFTWKFQFQVRLKYSKTYKATHNMNTLATMFCTYKNDNALKWTLLCVHIAQVHEKSVQGKWVDSQQQVNWLFDLDNNIYYFKRLSNIQTGKMVSRNALRLSQSDWSKRNQHKINCETVRISIEKCTRENVIFVCNQKCSLKTLCFQNNKWFHTFGCCQLKMRLSCSNLNQNCGVTHKPVTIAHKY